MSSPNPYERSSTPLEESLDRALPRLLVGALVAAGLALALTTVFATTARPAGFPLRNLAKLVFAPSAAGLSVYGLGRWRGGRRAGGEWVARLFLVTVSVAAGLIGGELLARLALGDVTTSFDTRYYPAAKWYGGDPIDYNSWGFRERELADLPRGDAFRIAMIGDGFLHSQGIADDDLLSRALERALNRRSSGRRYEVVNFAHSGAQTNDQTGYLVDYALRTEPDFVLLQWFINDAEADRPWRPPDLDVPGLRRIEQSFGISLRRELRPRSALFYVFAHWLGDVATRRGWVETYEEYMTARLADPDGVDARRAEAALARFVETARRHDLDVGVVAFPLLVETDGTPDGYPLGFLIDRVLDYCRREGLTCLDVREVLANRAPVTELWINRIDGHPGPTANRLVAGALVTAFGDRWGVAGGRP